MKKLLIFLTPLLMIALIISALGCASKEAPPFTPTPIPTLSPTPPAGYFLVS